MKKNNEGVKHYNALQGMPNLVSCQRACIQNSACLAVDFYLQTGYCLLYRENCYDPKATHSEASSYKISRRTKSMTVPEIKHLGIDVSKTSNSWQVISDSAACQQNGEAINSLTSTTETSLQDCHFRCKKDSRCASVDYFSATGICLLYSEVCTDPRDSHDGASSWRVSSAELMWNEIHKSKACEHSKEGIPSLSSGTKAESFENCKLRCELRTQCVAIDFYQNTKWCILYTEACLTPLSDVDGASSYYLTRAVPHQIQATASSSNPRTIEEQQLYVAKIKPMPVDESPAGSWLLCLGFGPLLLFLALRLTTKKVKPVAAIR